MTGVDLAAEFPGLAQSTYLNSCAHGLLPRRTRRAIERHLDRWEGAPDWGAWGEVIETARRAFARFIGAHDDEVAVQANATSGIAGVMNALPVGSRIATLDIDFPTTGFVAQRQVARGVHHDHLRLGLTPGAREWARATKGATLACAPAVASFSGYRLPLRDMVESAHAEGTRVMVDAFQACGTYPIDVHREDVDFLVTGVYKWLMAPAGLAFLYARRDTHAFVPTTSGWYGAPPESMIDPLAPLVGDARRFQYGGPSVVACAALPASLSVLDEIGLANVERANGALIERILDHCDARKLEVLTPTAPESRASIVTFRPGRGGQAGPPSGGVRVPDLTRALEACAREKVVVNTRLDGIRVSPHVYNTNADVDRLFAVLDAA